MESVKVKRVIVCKKAQRGKGTESSPYRIVTEVFDFNGKLIAAKDPIGGITPELLLEFLRHCYKDISEAEHKKRIHDHFLKWT